MGVYFLFFCGGFMEKPISQPPEPERIMPCDACGVENCPSRGKSPLTEEECGFTPRRMILTSLGVFIMPLLLAIAGAVAAGKIVPESGVAELLGGVIGLLAGIAAMKIVDKMVSRDDLP